MPHLVHVLTVPESLVFLRGHVAFMREHGWEMSIITSPGEALSAFGRTHDVPVYGVEMLRKMSPLKDAESLARVTVLLRRLRPDLVHSHTPKGGLFGTTAGAICRVPARIYHLRGMLLLTATGAQRKILTAVERTSCALATRILANSPSLREYAIAEGLCPASKITVLGSGSGNGVDCEGRFNPDLVAKGARADFRTQLNIPLDGPIVGFLGRLVRDKGIIELVDAWARIRARQPSAHLVIGGVFEERNAIAPETRRALEDDPRVHLLGFVESTPTFLASIDVLALPTYREGFPNVLIEAGSMGVPVVSTRVMGCVDAVVDGVTGMLVPAQDSTELAAALEKYITQPSLREEHGRAGRLRALREFRSEPLWRALLEVYREALEQPSTTTSSSSSSSSSSSTRSDTSVNIDPSIG